MASAAVAAFVTLLIEYFAKPRLEVRKERILERARRRSAMVRDLRRAAFLSGRLLGSRHNQHLEPIRDRMPQLAAEVEQLIRAAIEEMPVPAALDEDWNRITVTVIGTALWLQRADPPGKVWDEFDVASGKLDSYADLLSTSRWRWWRRRRLIREIGSLPVLEASAADGQQAAGTA